MPQTQSPKQSPRWVKGLRSSCRQWLDGELSWPQLLGEK
ncbi:hypothetical protein SynMINOS11_02120 [Synechococcus sp. Minos11]|nr:hypothetical protein SynMINOS11_02120 [Synechococcus sp. Minos11]